MRNDSLATRLQNGHLLEWAPLVARHAWWKIWPHLSAVASPSVMDSRQKQHSCLVICDMSPAVVLNLKLPNIMPSVVTLNRLLAPTPLMFDKVNSPGLRVLRRNNFVPFVLAKISLISSPDQGLANGWKSAQSILAWMNANDDAGLTDFRIHATKCRTRLSSTRWMDFVRKSVDSFKSSSLTGCSQR